MHTSKVFQLHEQQASPTPATRAAPGSSPGVPPQQPASLHSRPALPSLFHSADDARELAQSGQVAHSDSLRFKSASPRLPEGSKTHHDDVMASTVSSGTKRTRDGNDGPEGTPSPVDAQDRQKPVANHRAKGREPAEEDGADSHAQPSGKRARKTSKAAKSGKAHRPKPHNDGAGDANAPGRAPKTMPVATLPNQGGSAETNTAGASTWKPGAQSPGKDRAHRGSVTLSPRRSSNASTLESGSPPTRTEDLHAHDTADGKIVWSTPTLSGNDFTFHACDSDTDGIIRAVPGSASPGNEEETALSFPSSQASPRAVEPGTMPAVPQPAPRPPGLAPDMTALLEELDAALAKPIGM